MRDEGNNPNIDFGRRTDDYARLRPGFPKSFFDRLETFLPLSGVRAVDLGTGPGFATHEFARRGATAIGLDISPGQIGSARQLAQEQGLSDRVEFQIRAAEDLDLPDASVDLVFAGQCWGWFDNDVTLARANRVLKRGGLLVVGHYCYLARYSDVARKSEELILQINPSWSMAGFDGLYPHRIDALAGNDGFDLVEQFCYDEDQPFTHEQWRGRMRTCNGVGSGGMTEEQVSEYDVRLAELLGKEYPTEPILIPHRVFAVIVRKTGDLVAPTSSASRPGAGR